ncbi:MAG: TRAP transporter substrate-binding protein [Elusimicrobia bacterium]|nr:TRAP transporter substrate-binding protein [Elusimicrobiota bacterium]
MVRLCALALSVTLYTTLLAAQVAAGDPSPREIRFGIIYHHDGSASAYVLAAKKFKKDVEARSSGRLRVSLVDIATLDGFRRGRATAALKKVAAGEMEMCDLQGDVVADVFEPRLAAFDIPYLIRDYAHAERVVTGPAGRLMAERLADKQLTVLGYTYSGGFRVVASRKPLDPKSLRGLRIHVVENPILAEQFKSWGAVPVSGPRESSLGLLESGDVDAVETTYNFYQGQRLFHELPALTDLGHNFFVTVMLINKPFLESLSAQDRKIITSAAEAASAFERGETIRENEGIRRLYGRRGGTFRSLPEAERAQLKELSMPVRRMFAEIIGSAVIDGIEEEAPKDGPARKDQRNVARVDGR